MDRLYGVSIRTWWRLAWASLVVGMLLNAYTAAQVLAVVQ